MHEVLSGSNTLVMAVSYLVLTSICKLFEQVPFGFCCHRCSMVRWNVYFLLPCSRLQGTLWISCMCYCGTWTPSPCSHHLWLLLFQNAWFFKIQSIITIFPTFFSLKRVWISLARNLCFDPYFGAYTRIYQIWVHLSFFPCLHVSSILCQRLSSLFVCFGVLESGCAVFCLRYLLVWRKKGPPMSCKFFFSGDLMFCLCFVGAGPSCLVARW